MIERVPEYFKEEVKRDKYGYWTCSKLPDLGEAVTESQLFKRFFEWGFHVVIGQMQDDIDEGHPAWEYYESGSADISMWEPKPKSPRMFLLSIHDTEDGPQCWWAMPISGDGE